MPNINDLSYGLDPIWAQRLVNLFLTNSNSTDLEGGKCRTVLIRNRSYSFGGVGALNRVAPKILSRAAPRTELEPLDPFGPRHLLKTAASVDTTRLLPLVYRFFNRAPLGKAKFVTGRLDGSSRVKMPAF
jgi:hypothetical protein